MDDFCELRKPRAFFSLFVKVLHLDQYVPTAWTACEMSKTRVNSKDPCSLARNKSNQDIKKKKNDWSDFK